MNAELQLENSIFLYEKGEKEVALKMLMQIDYEELSFHEEYKYNLLKEQIHLEMT